MLAEMWRTSLLLLVLCSSLQADPEAPHAAREADHLRQRSLGTDAPVAGTEQSAQQPTARPLEEELDNQENIISQVGGTLQSPG